MLFEERERTIKHVLVIRQSECLTISTHFRNVQQSREPSIIFKIQSLYVIAAQSRPAVANHCMSAMGTWVPA